MKIYLLNADAIVVRGPEDLARMVPADRTGEPLNYGQGEGQFRVDDTAWGFYCAPRPYLQFEEGSLPPTQVLRMLDAILGAIRKAWGADIDVSICGLHSESFVTEEWQDSKDQLT